VLREIRGVEQRNPARHRRWFQDDYFDLFVWEDRAGSVLRFQLCYARDTRHERALEWQRGRGFQHLRVRQRYDGSLGREQSGDLSLDGVLPYATVGERFGAASAGLPATLSRFIAEKVSEYARPARKYRRPGARVPRWLERLREARRRFLDSEETGE